MELMKVMNSTNKIHLAKYLKNYGNYTKSEVKRLILEKRVLVNGIYQPMSYIVKEDDKVYVDNNLLEVVENVYYLYHKPVGIVCTNNLTVKNNIISHLNLPVRVFCVGRLDKDTSGLIILTNDGVFANSLINANNHIEKEYIVKLKYQITEEFLNKIQEPLILRGKRTNKVYVKVIDLYTLNITLTDGKYRQIRRLVINASNTVLSLVRIRIDKYKLEGLEVNELKEFKII